MALVLSSDSFKLGLVIVAATLYSSCLSAPATKSDPWWYHPCNTDIDPIRHSRSTSRAAVPPQVTRQLQIFLQQLSDSVMNINKLYKDQVSKTKKPANNKFRWLKIKKMLKQIKGSKKVLPEFYEALQYFSGTIEVLRHLKIRTNAVPYDEDKRNDIYTNVTYKMRALLCEVQDAFRVHNETVPKGIPLRKMKIRLPSTFGLTGAYNLDLNFFSKMKSFFVKSQRILQKKMKRKKKATSAVKPKRT